jgi:hypothetical protein
MTGKREEIPSLDLNLGEALEKFIHTKPGEIAEIIARDLAEGMKTTEKRLKQAREEISRGARTRRKRFRL